MTLAIPQYLFGFLVGIWLLFFVLGKRQLQQAKMIALELALSEVKAAKKANPDLTVDEYFNIFDEKWQAAIQNKVRFILHPSEFWPILATPDKVRSRLNLTPVWLGAFLKLNGFELDTTEEQKNMIDQIVAQSQKLAH